MTAHGCRTTGHTFATTGEALCVYCGAAREQRPLDQSSTLAELSAAIVAHAGVALVLAYDANKLRWRANLRMPNGVGPIVHGAEPATAIINLFRTLDH